MSFFFSKFKSKWQYGYYFYIRLIMDNFLIISPVRNEGQFIERTIKSVINQKKLPTKWIIVDDGSTDDTSEIVKKYSDKFKWMELHSKTDRGIRSVGPGVVEAFYFGLSKVNFHNYDFVCKMDGDIEFEEDYFLKLLEKFEDDQYLGAASGKPYIIINGKKVPERTNNEMVAGQMNFYKTKCFTDIGGFVQGSLGRYCIP